MTLKQVSISGLNIKIHKAVIGADFKSPTVLTDNPWIYVDLWLRRNGQKKAAMYWSQAREFNKAAEGLPIESATLRNFKMDDH